MASSKPQRCSNNRNRTEWASPGGRGRAAWLMWRRIFKRWMYLGTYFTMRVNAANITELVKIWNVFPQSDQLFYNLESLKQSYKDCWKYTRNAFSVFSFGRHGQQKAYQSDSCCKLRVADHLVICCSHIIRIILIPKLKFYVSALVSKCR